MHVLVVDDNDDIRFLLGHILRTHGHDVTEASSGRQALEDLQGAVLPHLVLLDIQMPDLSGWEVLEAVRADPRTADVPVVLCTVKGHPADLLRGWEAGCDGYVTKPFDIDRLAAELERIGARDATRRREVRRAGIIQARVALRDHREVRDAVRGIDRR